MSISNQVELRHCKIEDIAELLPLMEQFGRPATQDVLIARFESFIQNISYGVVVAYIENHPIGLVAWSKPQFCIYDKIRFYIKILVVDEWRLCIRNALSI